MPTHQKTHQLLKKELNIKGQLTKKEIRSEIVLKCQLNKKSYFSTCYSRRKIVKMCCDIQRHKLDAKSLKCGNSPKKVTPQPGAQKRASSEGPTHQKSFFTTIYSKKLVLKCQLTQKSYFPTIYIKKEF